MKIVVDLLGADKGAECIFKGVLQSIKDNDVEFILVGNKADLKMDKLSEETKNRITFIDTNECILNTEEPTFAVRRKKNASIVLAMKELCKEDVDGVISFGSTGAVLVSGLLICGRIEGIERAALTLTVPTNKENMILLDVGANIECTEDILKQFAIMGNIYAKEILNKENPKVALLNIGAEEEKGTKVLKQTYKEIKKLNINFVGNIEARDIFSGDVDVLVCDGFDGNIILKTVEGTAKFILENMKKAIMSSFLSKIGAIFIKSSMKSFKKKLDYKEYGACPMLGLKKVVFKGHGSSDEKAVVSGINSMINYINKDINKKIEDEFKKGEI